MLVLSYGLIINALLIGDYTLRYSYYKNVLCENVAKPELRCNGKCHLAKNLKAAASQEAPESPEIVSFKLLSNLNPNWIFSLMAPFVVLDNKEEILFQSNFYRAPGASIPSPPPELYAS